MAEWTMTPISVTVREVSGAIQPVVPTPIMLGQIPMYVNASGFYRLTGRRHERVTAMHAAYGRRSR